MMARDETGTAGQTASVPDGAAVRQVYERIERDGVVAGIEHMLSFCHEDVELRSYSAHAVGSFGRGADDVLRGRAEILDFFRRSAAAGTTVRTRTRSFDVEDDTVVVSGSIRVGRPDGSFAETKVRWFYRFRDGLVDNISWEPRAGD